MAQILVINASRIGEDGNSHVLGQLALTHLEGGEYLVLKDHLTPEGIKEVLTRIDQSRAVLFLTGTHWDSWSSVLQQFLEAATDSEGTSIWLGKPVGVIVSEHGTGGKGVLSRLQGVLNTFGCLLPPMTGMVYSRTGQTTIVRDGPGADDCWRLDDVETVCANLMTAAAFRAHWKSWPVDRKDLEKVWVA